MEIGEKIKELRIERGLTQEELADRAELSKGFISQVERDLNCDTRGHSYISWYGPNGFFLGEGEASGRI